MLYPKKTIPFLFMKKKKKKALRSILSQLVPKQTPKRFLSRPLTIQGWLRILHLGPIMHINLGWLSSFRIKNSKFES